MMAIKWLKNTRLFVCTIAGIIIISTTGCGGGGVGEDGVIINGDFPIVFAQRNMDALGNPTDGVRFSPGGDLFMKDVSAPLTEAVNLTSSYTQGQGDVSDPEVNFDATKVVFAMRGPSDATFNIWEFNLASNTLSRLIQDNLIAEEADDVDPAYLPEGIFVNFLNVQKTTRQKMVEENVQPYTHLDEYEREATIALHVFDPSTQEITQISFNQSHDRNATVLKTGEIMYSRWDHVANRNHFPVFIANPDGTNLFVEYGAFSPGNSFLHPREMQDGRVMTSLMPLSGTDEAGAIMLLDVKNYSDACEPGPGLPQNCNGQTKVQLTNLTVSYDDEFSPGGRFTTPYPLWDGTNRALVSFRPAPPNPTTVTDPMTGVTEFDQGVPEYSIYMMDLSSGTLRPVHLSSSGKALVDPIAIIPRGLGDTPAIIGDKFPDPALATESNGLGGTGMGVFNVRSVYDTDGLDIMGDSVLAPGESIPKLLTGEPDLAAMKNPANSAFLNRPARFVRVTRAIPTPPGMVMDAIGESEFEMQEILGYAQVEPDGSYRVRVPADTPLSMTVLDGEGRAFQTHTNWLQVRPGETRTCSGCHSPRRAESALNVAPIAGSHANALGAETMAETRARLQGTPSLNSDVEFTEYWSNGLEANFTLSLANMDTPVPDNGRIDYVTHIQPLWDKDRGLNTCTGCHRNSLLADPISAGLSLEGGLSGFAGHVISYDQLMRGPFKVDENGIPLPPVVTANGRVIFPRGPALVRVGSSANSSRTSHLVETIYNSKLRAGGSYDIGATDHAAMLTDDEKWLISTWVDVGAQYTNEPYELVNGQYVVRDAIVSSRTVSRTVFNDQIHPILQAECMSCHAPGGFGGDSTVDPNEFADENDETHDFNRFVLTGNQSGDFNVTRAMINNLCDPMNNDLLLRPISDNVAPNLPHPQILMDINDPLSATQPVFSDTGPNSSYDIILTWLMMGEASNPTCLN